MHSENNKKMEMNRTDSDIIKIIRYPLIIFVVFIHSMYGGIVINGINIVEKYDLPIYDFLQTLITHKIAELAVPTFFFISGYLFFKNINTFSFSIYKNKLKNRISTLLTPYIIWNLLYILFYWIAQTFFPKMMSGNALLIKDYSVIDFIKAFWCGQTGFPINFPLWYIRDLMIINILSPIIYLLLKYLKTIYIIIIGIIWIFYSYVSIPGIGTTSVYFFSLGAFLAFRKHEIHSLPIKLFPVSILLYTILISIQFIFKDFEYNYIIHNIDIMIGGFSLWGGIGILIEKKILNAEFNSNSTFFIYAYHAIPLIILCKLLIKMFEPSSDLVLSLIYIISPIIIVLVGNVLYKEIKRFSPLLINLICGNR